MRLMKWAAAAATVLTLSVPAQAALFDRGGGMIYDSELNITWLQNWNQAAGSSYDTFVPGSGLMDWDTANTWANNLVYGSYSDWRLPTIVDTGAAGCDFSRAGGTDCGYNVQTKSGATVYSEMAHLYYVTLGNKAYCPPGDASCSTAQPGWGLMNTGPFTNVQSDAYWSGTGYAPYPGYAWLFGTGDGAQGSYVNYVALYAVAVRPGDVVSSVPEPQSYLMMLLGLGAVAVVVRRRPH